MGCIPERIMLLLEFYMRIAPLFGVRFEEEFIEQTFSTKNFTETPFKAVAADTCTQLLKGIDTAAEISEFMQSGVL